jgi:hypothetical protein
MRPPSLWFVLPGRRYTWAIYSWRVLRFFGAQHLRLQLVDGALG